MVQRLETYFRHYKSAQVLKNLATAPFDLSIEGNLNQKRLARFAAHAGDFKLLYGTERVTDDVMHALKELSNEAKLVEKMHAMQRGDVINKIEGFESENRSVLHTAMRDLFSNPNQGKAAAAATDAEKKSARSYKNF